MVVHPNDHNTDRTGYTVWRFHCGAPSGGLSGRKASKLASLALGLTLLASGCALPASTGTAPTSQQGQLAGSVAADPAAPAGAPLQDPLAPATRAPIVRGTAKPHPTARGSRGAFSSVKPVAYPDGVSVSVDRVTASVEKGNGRGVFPGRPNLSFSISIHNGSTRALDLNQVVVTTDYGSPARIASPVYEDPAANDFFGTVAPGRSATATYIFAVPVNQRSALLMTVDFDSVHLAAQFSGAAR